jgi:hypothetical protein
MRRFSARRSGFWQIDKDWTPPYLSCTTSQARPAGRFWSRRPGPKTATLTAYPARNRIIEGAENGI